MDFSSLPDGTPIWLVIIAVLTTILMTISERVAKIKGPLGAAARYWNERQLRKVQQKRQTRSEIDEYVDERMEEVMEQVAELKDQVASMRSELRDVRSERDLFADYSSELTLWWYRLRQWLSEQGLRYSEPFPSFQKFKDDRSSD